MSPRLPLAGPLPRALLLLALVAPGLLGSTASCGQAEPPRALASSDVAAARPGPDPGPDPGLDPALAGVEWMHVLHRQFPIAFDVPEETSVQRVGVFGLARPRTDDRELIEVDIFGLRDLPLNLAAVQFGFFWVTPEYQGADAESLLALLRGIASGEASIEFLARVFYQQMDVQMRDLGRHYVDGQAGRRIEVQRVIARGTKDERVVRGQVVLVPLSDSTALAVIARFDDSATPGEVATLFPRVLDSVRIGAGSRPGALRAALGSLPAS